MAQSAIVATPVTKSTRHDLRILGLCASAYLLAVGASSFHPRAGTWGIDAVGYLPTAERWLLLAVMAGCVATPFAASIRRARTPEPGSCQNRRARVLTWSWAPWILPVLYAVMLYQLRTRSYFLGDQEVWLDNIRAGQYPLYSEPLSAIAWRAYASLLQLLGISLLNEWLALLPVLCGVIASIIGWRICRYLAPGTNVRLVAFALLVTLGTTQLYCGYIESYPVAAVAMLLYLWVGLRYAHDQGTGLLLALTLALAVTSHLVAFFLIPSYLILIMGRKSSWLYRAVLILLPAAAAYGVIWLLKIDATDLTRPFHILRVAVESAGRGGIGPTGSLAPAARAVDLVNAILLVMPVPAALLLSRVLTRGLRFKRPDPNLRFLGGAAGPGILIAAVLVLPGTPAQDWDLIAIAILPAALLAILIACTDGWAQNPGGTRFAAPILGLASLLAFVLVNTSESAALNRFKTIIDPSVAMSAHERAYANEKLVKYYTALKESDSVLVYAQRAHAAEPENTRYWGNIGTALYNLHRYEEAARYFEEALRRGSDRAEVYYNLGLCYMRTQRYGEALKDFRVAVNLAGEQPRYLNSLGLAMLATGNRAGARSVWLHVRKLWPEFEPTALALKYYFGEEAQQKSRQQMP